MSGKIVLVTGGARSGKSLFAERYAAKDGGKVAYIATAQVLDGEMEQRVLLHKERRPSHWLTFEAPFAAHQAVADLPEEVTTILFDCLTLYTSNLLLSSKVQSKEGRYRYVMEQIDKLLNSAREKNACVVFVTNEVGQGIVPENALAREYRDLSGLVNQKAAQAADEVYLTVSGLAVEIKSLAVNL
jgi:adenosylcobinamide kinase/adenosylcobinamide-phosphate guanylyltransferase